MSDELWEELGDLTRRQNARIAALEKIVQAMTLAYQDVSTVLAQAQYRILELEKRLAQDEESAAWKAKERTE